MMQQQQQVQIFPEHPGFPKAPDIPLIVLFQAYQALSERGFPRGLLTFFSPGCDPELKTHWKFGLVPSNLLSPHDTPKAVIDRANEYDPQYEVLICIFYPREDNDNELVFRGDSILPLFRIQSLIYGGLN